jgi:iron(III) transport system substrate-binding protein
MRGTLGRVIPVLVLVGIACGPAAQPARDAASAPADAASAPAGAAQPGAAKPEWQVEWERTVAAARQEGKVVVFGPPGDLVRKNMLDGFKAAFPDITLEWYGGRGADHATRLEIERAGGVHAVDVVLAGTSVALGQLQRIDALDPIKPALILPEVTNPGNWWDNRVEYADRAGERNLVFTMVPVKALAYDASQVRPEEIDELEDLLDPKWKGKLVINDPTSAGAGNAVFKWLWHLLGPDKGPAYMRGLKEQAGAVDREQRRQLEWVVRGRYPLLMGPSSAVLGQLLEEGLQASTLNEFKGHGGAVTASFGSMMLLKQAPHPHAAKVYMNWLLTRDGQTAYSQGAQEASRRLDVPSDHLPPDLRVKAGVQYWPSYVEDYALMPPEANTLLRELFPG